MSGALAPGMHLMMVGVEELMFTFLRMESPITKIFSSGALLSDDGELSANLGLADWGFKGGHSVSLSRENLFSVGTG